MIRAVLVSILAVLAACCILPQTDAEVVDTGDEDVVATYTLGKTERVLHPGDRVSRMVEEIVFKIIADGRVTVRVDGTDTVLDVDGFTDFVQAFEGGGHTVHFVFDSGRVVTYAFEISTTASSDDPWDEDSWRETETVTITQHNSEITNTLIMTFLLTMFGFYISYRYVRYRKSMEVSDV